MSKIALISGFSGQDGSHMADFLLSNTDLTIVGLIRHVSNKNWRNINHLKNNPRVIFENCDITDPISVETVINKYKPKYFFNFGANSFVGNSWSQPVNHLETNTLSVIYILEAIRKYSPLTRLYQSGSSEMFGDVKYSPQDEKHPFSPRSMYGVSKVASHYAVKVYRESYNLYALSGYLFNHESSAGRRGEMFLTRKCSTNVARIYHSIKNWKRFEPMRIGNVFAKRDWSAAEDFVRGIYMMMNQETFRKDLQPELYQEGKYTSDLINPLKEYVLASNETHEVREFIEKSFLAAGIEGVWVGEGMDMKYIHAETGDELVIIDPQFYRAAEVDLLWGTPEMAQRDLGWKAEISFDELVKRMTRWDIENYQE
jgi:GDPmannose 4,6-dehydratase